MIDFIKILFKTTTGLIFGCIACLCIYLLFVGLGFIIKQIMDSNHRIEIIASIWIVAIASVRYMITHKCNKTE